MSSDRGLNCEEILSGNYLANLFPLSDRGKWMAKKILKSAAPFSGTFLPISEKWLNTIKWNSYDF
jgi:hypothetical protein